MEHVVITIDSTGDATFLVSGTTKEFISSRDIICRASHIQPSYWRFRVPFRLLRFVFGDEGRIADWTRNWSVAWRINLTPVGGPILGSYVSRSLAINDEVLWLEKNFL